MTIEGKVTAILKECCSSVYPDFAPEGTPKPYITYARIGGQAALYGDGSLRERENAEFQISAWAETRKAASELMSAVEAAMVDATSIDATPVGASVGDSDSDVGAYGSRQDFSVWADR